MNLVVPVEALWGIAGVALAAAASYGGLLVRVVANAKRITEVELSTAQAISVIEADLKEVIINQTQHRVETTDRLARIESKIDFLVGTQR